MATNQNGRILLVMSDSLRNDLTSLVEGDYRFEETESVEDAMRLLSGDSYDVVVVDETLPAPGWREVSRFLRKNKMHAAMLVCTGEVGGKEIFAESRRDDAHLVDVLIRPFSRDLVEGRIRAALSGKSDEVHEGATLPSHPL